MPIARLASPWPQPAEAGAGAEEVALRSPAVGRAPAVGWVVPAGLGGASAVVREPDVGRIPAAGKVPAVERVSVEGRVPALGGGGGPAVGQAKAVAKAAGG